MKPIDPRTQQQIIQLLIPFMLTERERSTLFTLAFGPDHTLLYQLDFSGSPQTALTELIQRTLAHGELRPGVPALWALLEVVRQQVGLDKQVQIDRFRALLGLPPTALPDRVFVSYSRKNETFARRIELDLQDAGLKVWFDRFKIRGGEEWRRSIEKGIARADFIVFCLSPDSIASEICHWELNTAKDQGKLIIPIMLVDCIQQLGEPTQQPIAWLQERHILNFTQPDEYSRRFKELLAALPGYNPPDNYYEDSLDTRQIPNPFRGLEAFRELDYHYFAGRETAVAELVQRVQDPTKPRLLAVVGASGSGKSSLVRAGLLPTLRDTQTRQWETAVFKPGTQPLHSLAERLELRFGQSAADLREQFLQQPNSLHELVSATLSGNRDEARFLLVVDQFEEIFAPAAEQERQAFLDLLLAAVNHTHSPVHVLLTLRADFFGYLSAYPELAGLVAENQLITTVMTAEQLRRCIEVPAQKVGLVYEAELVEQILEAVREQPGALPLLQYALKELYERRRGRTLTIQAYQDIDGVQGALATRAEVIFSQLDTSQQTVMRRVLLQLVEVGEEAVTRRRVRLATLQLQGIVAADLQAVVDLLTTEQARLLVASAPIADADRTNDAEIDLEVSHEALLTHWERLARWIADDRDDLRRGSEILALANTWNETGRTETSYLLTGGRLATAREWLARSDATNLQRDFVNASTSFFESEQKRTLDLQQRALNRTRLAAAIFAVFLVVAIGLSLFALDRQGQAENSAETSDSNVTIAIAAVASATVAQGQAVYSAATSDANAATSIAAQATSIFNENLAATQVAIAGTEQERAEINATDSADNAGTAVANAVTATVAQGEAQINATLSFNNAATALANAATATVAQGQALVNATFSANNAGTAVANAETATVAQGEAQINATQSFNNAETAIANASTATVAQGQAQQNAATAVIAQGQAEQNATISANNAETAIANAETATVAQGQAEQNAATATIALGESQQRGTQVAEERDRSESLRLSTNTNALLQENPGDVELAALLSLRALDASYTEEVDAVLTRVLERLYLQQVIAIPESETYTLPDVLRLIGYETRADEITSQNSSARTAVEDEIGITIQDTATNTVIQIIPYPLSAPIIAYLLDPLGERIAITTSDGLIDLWDIDNNIKLQTFVGHTGTVSALAFSADGRLLLTGGEDNTARLWDTTSGLEVQRFIGHSGVGRNVIIYGLDPGGIGLNFLTTGGVTHVEFTDDEKTLLTSSINDNTIRLWNKATGAEIRRFAPSPIENVAFIAEDQQVVAWDKNEIRLWNARPEQLATGIRSASPFSNSAIFSPDGSHFFTADADGKVRAWQTSSLQFLYEFGSLSGGAVSLSISDDGKYLAIGSGNGYVEIWNLLSRQRISDWIAVKDGTLNTSISFGVEGNLRNSGNAITVQISPDGRYVLTNGSKLWEAQTGLLLRTFDSKTSRADLDKNLIYSLQDGQFVVSDLLNLQVHKDFVAVSATEETKWSVSPDGTLVAFVNPDSEIQIYDVETGMNMTSFDDITGGINSLIFSPDSTYLLLLLTGGNNIQVRKTSDGRLVRQLIGHSEKINSAAFSPDERLIVTSSIDGTVRLWLPALDLVVETICQRLSRDLTIEELAAYKLTDPSPTCPQLGLEENQTIPTQTPIPTPIIATSVPLPTLAPTSTPTMTANLQALIGSNGGINREDGRVYESLPGMIVDVSDKDDSFNQRLLSSSYSDFIIGTTFTWGPGAAEDSCGVIFRFVDNSNFYALELDRQQGVLFTIRVDEDQQETTYFTSSAIHSEPGASNELTLVAEGDSFGIFINDQYITSLQDDRYSAGLVAIAAGTLDESDASYCQFTETWTRDLTMAMPTLTPTPDVDTPIAEVLNKIGLSMETGYVSVRPTSNKIDLTDKDNVLQLLPASSVTYTDFVISTNIVFGPGAAEDYCGIYLRASDDDNFYTINLNRMGSLYFQEREGGEWNDVQIIGNIVTEPSPHLTVQVAGNMVRVYINGLLQDEIPIRISAGKVGFLASTYDASDESSCQFDNNWVWVPTGSAVFTATPPLLPTSTPTPVLPTPTIPSVALSILSEIGGIGREDGPIHEIIPYVDVQIVSPTTENSKFTFLNNNYSDFVLGTTVEWGAGTDNIYCGILIRAIQNNSFFFDFGRTGFSYFNRIENGVMVGELEVDQTFLSKVPDTPNQVTVVARGRDILLFFNGQFVGQFFDARPVTGGVGLGVSNNLKNDTGNCIYRDTWIRDLSGELSLLTPMPPLSPSDEALIEASGGLLSDGGAVATSIEQLTLDLDVSIGQWKRATLNDSVFADLIISATLDLNNTTFSNSCGLFFRQRENSFYSIEINRGGDLLYRRSLNGVSTTSRLNGTAIRSDEGATNDLTIFAVADRFLVFLNGQYSGQFQDDSLQAGYVGLLANQGATTPGRACEFTNIWVRNLSESDNNNAVVATPTNTPMPTSTRLPQVVELEQANGLAREGGSIFDTINSLVLDNTGSDNVFRTGFFDGIYTDFVVGTTFQWGPGDRTDYCGIRFRSLDDDNYLVVQVTRLLLNNQDIGGVQFTGRVAGKTAGNNTIRLAPSTKVEQNETNTLVIVGIGSVFTLYINGEFAGQHVEDRLSTGQIGLVAGTRERSGASNCTFTDAWTRDLTGAIPTLTPTLTPTLNPTATLSAADYSTAIANNPADAALYTQRANAYVRERDYEQAIPDFARAIEIEPTPLRYLYRGNAYYNTQQYELALADYTQALALNEDVANEAIYLTNRGNAYRELGNFEAAVADYTQAIELEPTAARYNARGNIYNYNLGNYDLALLDYAQSLEINTDTSNEALYLTNQGDAYRFTDQFEAAITDYTAALQIGETAERYLRRGISFYELGRYEPALLDFNQALEINEDSVTEARYLSWRGDAHRQLGQFEEAVADYTQAIELEPTSFRYNARGNVYNYNLGEYEQAVTNYTQALELSNDATNDKAIYLTNRGDAYRSSKKDELAIIDYSAAIEIISTPYRHNRRGLSYLNLELFDEALADFTTAIDENEDIANETIYLTNRGRAYRDSEQYVLALADYNSALDLQPDNISALQGRAITYYWLDDLDLAITDFQHTVSINPDSAFNHDWLGWIYYLQDMVDESLIQYARSLEIDPHYAATYRDRAMLYAAEGETKLALNDFTRAVELAPDSLYSYDSPSESTPLSLQFLGRQYSRWIAYEDGSYIAFILRGSVFAYTGDYDAAVADFQRSLQLQPDFAAAYAALGDVYYTLEQWDEARQSYEEYVLLAGENADSDIVERLERMNENS